MADVSSAASRFQLLSLRNSKVDMPSTEDNHAVVLPSHLQDLAADCSHLSFGTYNRGTNSASSVTLPSNLSIGGWEEKVAAVDGYLAKYNASISFPSQLLSYLALFVLAHFPSHFSSAVTLYTMVINSPSLMFLETQPLIKIMDSLDLCNKSL